MPFCLSPGLSAGPAGRTVPVMAAVCGLLYHEALAKWDNCASKAGCRTDEVGTARRCVKTYNSRFLRLLYHDCPPVASFPAGGRGLCPGQGFPLGTGRGFGVRASGSGDTRGGKGRGFIPPRKQGENPVFFCRYGVKIRHWTGVKKITPFYIYNITYIICIVQRFVLYYIRIVMCKIPI